jgi:dihydroorotate dehydrogenase (fumarate)
MRLWGLLDLTTNYLGYELKNPLIASASPLSRETDNVRALEDAGAAAVVMYSLFEEQARHETHELGHYFSFMMERSAEAQKSLPDVADEGYPRGPYEYLDHVARLKEAVDIPIFASLNGTTDGGWIEYARGMEAAGADAIELNVHYFAADPLQPGSVVEQRCLDILTEVKRTVSIPVAVKLGPFFSSFAHVAKRLDGAGADGLVMFNRFYQPDIDIENRTIVPRVYMSDSDDLLLPLRWIAAMYGQLRADMAATSGVHTAEDVIRTIMVGANAAMMCSALLKHGIGTLWHVINGVESWLEEHGFASVREVQGSMSQQTCPDPSAFERANYVQALNANSVEGEG